MNLDWLWDEILEIVVEYFVHFLFGVVLVFLKYCVQYCQSLRLRLRNCCRRSRVSSATTTASSARSSQAVNTSPATARRSSAAVGLDTRRVVKHG